MSLYEDEISVITHRHTRILFRTQDLSRVKQYCYSSWEKILDNRASIQDFIFAKEVRLGTYSDRGAPPPGAMVAARRRAVDPNDEPQYGDRIPYVITVGEPNTRLADRAVTPEDMFQKSVGRPDSKMTADSRWSVADKSTEFITSPTC